MDLLEVPRQPLTITETISGYSSPSNFNNQNDIYFKSEAEIDAENRAKTNRLYALFYQIVTSVTFNFLIYCTIFVNTVTLAMYRYD